MHKIFKFILTVFLLAILSCEANQTPQRNNFTVEQARSWFEGYVQSKPTPSTNGSGGAPQGVVSTQAIRKTIFWDMAKPLKIEGMPDGYAIPLWYEERYRFGRQTIRELWIYQDARGSRRAHIAEALATSEYMQRHNNQLDMSDFTGAITLHDWHDGFSGGAYYENGVITGAISDYRVETQRPTASTIATEGRTQADCGYQYNYVSNGVIYVTWVYQPCMQLLWWLLQNTSYANPSYTQQWLDAQYGCETSGTCISDTNPSYNYEPEPDPEKVASDDFDYNKIFDSNLKPCMQLILNSLKGQNIGSVAGNIKRFSGEFPDWNWEVKDGRLDPNVLGETISFYDRKTHTVTTVFDSQKFRSATDLSVARTILHESVHAFLIVYFATDPLMARATYTELVDAWEKKNDLEEVQHDEMVRSFITGIALALQEFGTTNNGYDISFQYYLDLAWGGLDETSAFKKLPASDQSRIKSVISSEFKGIDDTGAAQAPKGKSAKC